MNTKSKKERADKLLVDQGLARSRTQAQALIMAGKVCVGDALVKKPSDLFSLDTGFRLKEGALPKYVSRGGEKLEGALRQTALDVTGKLCLDIGISTGGFTDCLLQHGAARVIGIDVGHNQLAWKLRQDSRVTLHEGINARALDQTHVGEMVDVAVVDVSFISLELILPRLPPLIKADGHILALIKPQFEVEKHEVGKGGLIKDPLLHRRVRDKIKKICEMLGFNHINELESPIEGTDGNKEFFIFAQKPQS